jgi:hypothetical protein
VSLICGLVQRCGCFASCRHLLFRFFYQKSSYRITPAGFKQQQMCGAHVLEPTACLLGDHLPHHVCSSNDVTVQQAAARKLDGCL